MPIGVKDVWISFSVFINAGLSDHELHALVAAVHLREAGAPVGHMMRPAQGSSSSKGITSRPWASRARWRRSQSSAASGRSRTGSQGCGGVRRQGLPLPTAQSSSPSRKRL